MKRTILATLLATVATMASAEHLYISNSTREMAPEFFEVALPLAEQCQSPMTFGTLILKENLEVIQGLIGELSRTDSYAESPTLRTAANKIEQACGLMLIRRQEENERLDQQQLVRSEADAEVERRQKIETAQTRVTLEAAKACLELDNRDPVAARTNQLCHDIFMQTKYR